MNLVKFIPMSDELPCLLGHITEEITAGLPELTAIARDQPHHASSGIELDTAGNVERAIALCKNYVRAGDVAVQGSGGDERTYHLACEIRDLGLSPQKAHEIIRDHWNDACSPPWDADELAVKVRNAAEYAQNEPGAWAVPSGQELFAAFAASLPDTSATRAPRSFRDLLLRTVTPVREIIAGLVEKQTVTFLSGVGGSNKSRVGLQLGCSVHAGRTVFGREVERCHFVYVSYEDPEDEVARRAQTIVRRLSLPGDIDPDYFDLVGKDAPYAVIYESGDIEMRPFGNELRDHLKSIPGHKFVLADSCYNFLRFVGAAKINEGAVMAGIGLLQRLCDDCDCTLIVLWHPSQAGQERGDASGWSVAWHNAPRARLSITPLKDVDDAFDLKVEKRNHGPKGQSMTLYWSDGVLLPRTETATGEQKGHFMRSVVRVAIMAAKQAAPITMQKRLFGWQLDEIEHDIGRRPSNTEVKEALAAALPAGLLRYVRGSNSRVAGYYPADQHQAEELARAAKHQADAGGNNG